MGKALHCYQDVYAHGNVDAGYGKLMGHGTNGTYDNPYYAWKSGSNKTSVVKQKNLTCRYYETRDKTKTVLRNFLKNIRAANFYNYIEW